MPIDVPAERKIKANCNAILSIFLIEMSNDKKRFTPINIIPTIPVSSRLYLRTLK
jgi:hypothetical protein